MRLLLVATAIGLAVVSSSASAQGVNLSGRWQCMANCLGASGSFAFITQNGWQLNVVNDAGVPSRDQANQGAIYAPDGFTLQFDGGTIWQRAPELPPPPPRRIR